MFKSTINLFIVIFLISFIISCKDKDLDLSDGQSLQTSQLQIINNIDKKSYLGLEDVFSDNGTIGDTSRSMLLVFGSKNCIYCDKLKDAIKNNADIKQYLQENFKSYYISLDYFKLHNITFINKSLNTNALARLYNVAQTPLVVLLDSKGEGILRVPGFTSKEDFLKMLKFSHLKEYENEKYKSVKASSSDKLRMKIFNEWIQNN